MHDAADLFEHVGEVVRSRGRRGDRVHRAQFHARGHDAQGQRSVAVGGDLRVFGRGGRDAVTEVEIALRPLITGFEQHHVGVDDALRLLAESERNLLTRRFQVEAVEVAQHAKGEHVLAALGIRRDLVALILHRDFAHVVTGFDEALVGFAVGRRNVEILVLAPHAFKQDDAAGLEFAGTHPSKQHLFVEGHHQIGLVAAVGDVVRADTDAVAAGPGHATGGRTNFRRDDLGGPDAVAHARGNRAKRLPAALRSLAGIADDLDDMFAEAGHRLAVCLLVFGLLARFLRAFLYTHIGTPKGKGEGGRGEG